MAGNAGGRAPVVLLAVTKTSGVEEVLFSVNIPLALPFIRPASTKCSATQAISVAVLIWPSPILLPATISMLQATLIPDNSSPSRHIAGKVVILRLKVSNGSGQVFD